MTRRRKSVTGDAGAIRLSQIAPWNSRLTNPYRTRWCEVDGRKFKIHTDCLDGLWEIDEVDADGELIGRVEIEAGKPVLVDHGLITIAFTLAEAKLKIAEACGLTGEVVR